MFKNLVLCFVAMTAVGCAAHGQKSYIDPVATMRPEPAAMWTRPQEVGYTLGERIQGEATQTCIGPASVASPSAIVKKAIVKEPIVKRAIVKKAIVKAPIVKKAIVKKVIVKRAIVKKAIVKKAIVKRAIVKRAIVKKAAVRRPSTSTGRPKK